MAQTIVLITGTNRGIGKGLLEHYLARPNHTVIAGNRDPNHPTSKALLDLPTAQGTSLIIVKIDSTSPNDAAAAVKQLTSQGIDHFDIVIANSGIALCYPKICEVKVEDIQKHVDTNIYGWIYLYQATLPLLKKSRNPLWVTVGSSAAFLTDMISSQNAAYAPTKLVQHWYTRGIHMEEPTITAFPIHPGWVRSDIGNYGASLLGLPHADVPVEESVSGMLKVIDASTRETHGGKMWIYDGTQASW